MTSHPAGALAPATRRPPLLDGDGLVVFDVVDDGALAAVRLLQEVRRPRNGPSFGRVPGGWRLRFDPGPVDRLEYRLSLTGQDGHTAVVTDPANEDVVGNPFGDRSVWTRPGYEPPSWTSAVPTRRGSRSAAVRRPRALDGEVPVRRWTHPGLAAGDAAPLVVVHDGPAFVDEAGLGHLLDTLVDDPSVPPFRVAALGAQHREQWYSADPAYTTALVDELLPLFGRTGPRPGPTSRVVGVGASLGALAHLYAAATRPGTHDALLLLSGSYFRPLLDGVESGFPWFDRITAFTDRLVAEGPPGPPVRVTISCGTVEENRANNDEVAAVLADAGWPTTVVHHRDAHTMTAWRDVLDPHLRDLLRDVGRG